MFGYVRPLMSELRVREAEAYRAFYCGVCRRLGRQCGPMCRLFLRYDFALLALVADVALDEESIIVKARCAVNPLKRLRAADGLAVAYAADAHGILLLGKAMDDRADGVAALRAPVPVLRRMAGGAARRRPLLYEKMLAMLKAQRDAEKEKAEIDEASRPFAEFCEDMFSPDEMPPEYRDALRWVGLHLGKWIYMADALDDYDRDRKKGAFNPFSGCPTRAAAAARALPLMNLCAEQALLAWDVMPERRHHPLVRNVLALGLFKTANSIAAGGGSGPKREPDGAVYPFP